MNIKGTITMLVMAVMLTGCKMVLGERVEVPPSHVAKIQTKNGYREGVIPTSRFRLDRCFVYCDRLVTLNVNDYAEDEKFSLFMPHDRLILDFTVRLTLSVNPDHYDMIFNRVPPNDHNHIDLKRAYRLYAAPIMQSEIRRFMSEYSIGQIASNREAIGAEMMEVLAEKLAERTPFVLRYAGLAELDYPPIIVRAQERAAERREAIAQEEAQLEIARVQFSRQLEEAGLARKVEVEKARSEAEVARINAQMMTPEYQAYRQLQILEKIAESDNVKFVPIEMLSSISGQVQVGNLR